MHVYICARTVILTYNTTSSTHQEAGMDALQRNRREAPDERRLER